MPLEPGDLVLLLTDGIPEARSADDTPLHIEQALAVVRAHRDRPAREILHALYQSVRAFCSPRLPHDDITAVVLKVGG